MFQTFRRWGGSFNSTKSPISHSSQLRLGVGVIWGWKTSIVWQFIFILKAPLREDFQINSCFFWEKLPSSYKIKQVLVSSEAAMNSAVRYCIVFMLKVCPVVVLGCFSEILGFLFSWGGAERIIKFTTIIPFHFKKFPS